VAKQIGVKWEPSW